MRTFEATLVLADISGYTKFVVMHRASLIHAEEIITELMEGVTHNAAFPLTMQKLEGDAAFLSAEITGDRSKAIRDVMAQVTRFMDLFHTQQRKMFYRTVDGCPCSACQNIEMLDLKCVVHVGEVLEKQISGRTELAGEPVIVAHRLLKNDLDAEAYIIATDPVVRALDAPPYETAIAHIEDIEDIGAVRITAYLPQRQVMDREGIRPVSWPVRKLTGLMLAWRVFLRRVQRRTRPFRHLPD